MICPSCRTDNRPAARGCRRCGKALPTLVPGDVVDRRFEVLGLLGTGGMGVVYKATDRMLDEIVAVKTLRADLDDDVKMASRFRSEIRLARKVSSPHVCRIYEYGEDGDRRYISMEYVDGVTLRDLVHESGGLPVDVALDIVVQIVTGLTAIHDSGIMHRDVKPSNLMRTRAGLIKLMDFGIAKEIDGVTLTAAGQAVGTPEYMSPEQVTGRKLDLRTDIYTTGIVLFELLTGVSPFRAESLLESAHKQVNEQPDLRTPGIPAALAPVLGRALAKDREARFGSVRDLSRALTAARRAPVSSPAPTPGPSPVRPGEPAAPSAPPPGRRPTTAESQAMAPPEVGELVAALRGPDPMERRRAVLALAEAGFRSSAAVQALAEALADADPRVRFMAAAALGRIGPAAEAAVPDLLAALDDEAAGNEAAESLVRIGRAAVPALLEMMKSGDEKVRVQAATTLTRIGAGQRLRT
jgi:protein kinase-like protein/HEAT repeat protein/Armadillo/beta-catenin-like repeat-containing protein